MSFSVDVSNALVVILILDVIEREARHQPGSFVKKQDWGVLQQCPRNRNSLFFTTAQSDTSFSDFGIISCIAELAQTHLVS
jgi:hypothetical protein